MPSLNRKRESSMANLHPVVRKFCERRYFSKKNIIDVKSNGNKEYIYLEDPLVLARLAGHIKHELGQPSKGYQVFMRGQTKDYNGMYPSIFRNIEDTANHYPTRLNAFENLVSKIRNIKNLKRFQGEIGKALLQQYGIRTPWLDLVDTIFVALRFATRQQSDKAPFTYHQTTINGTGWIYFIRVEDPLDRESLISNRGIVKGKNSLWCDLRCYQTSLSLRAHTQHGIYCTLRNSKIVDLDDYIVASVKFKVTDSFLSFIDEFIPFSMSYMFPNQNHDNTFKYLRQKSVTELISKIENDHGLAHEEMGRINLYR